MIEVYERERTSILDKIEAEHGRHIRKCSIAIVGVEDIALVATPASVGTDEFVDGVPSLLIGQNGIGFVGRVCNHLTPEETVEIDARWTGDHPICNVKIGKPS